MMKGLSRREFLGLAAACAASSVLPGGPLAATAPREAYKGKLCFFSKALPGLDWKELARAAKGMGFEGIDLTVRPLGHVAPERAAADLPKAVEAIRSEGLEVPMITTALVSASDPTARPILSTAAKMGISYFKAGYYRYKLVDVRKELEAAGAQFRSLADLSKDSRIQLGYHNHEDYVGAPVWDMARVIEPLDSRWAGFYFDPRHAVAEGGVGGWKIALNLILPRLKMVATKDFYWDKSAGKGWRDVNCPLGEGMVDWKYFFKTVAAAGFHGPISLHQEYIEYEEGRPLPAATHDKILTATAKDLEFLKARVREAYS